MNTPLLLIAWRRPHTLRQVIDAIRPVAPKHLYVVCDHPNPERPGEAEKVAATQGDNRARDRLALQDRKPLLRCELGLTHGG